MPNQPMLEKNSTWFVEGAGVANVSTTPLIRERVPFTLEPLQELPGQWWKFTILSAAPAECRPPIARDEPKPFPRADAK